MRHAGALQRVVRWLFRGVLGALALVAATCSLVALFLSTEHGKQRLSEWVVERVNQDLPFPGRVSVGRLETLRPSAIVLDDVTLTSEEHEVLRLEKVRCRPELWPLLRGEIVLATLELERGSLELDSLAHPEHAPRPSAPAPKDPPSPTDGLRLSIERLSARGLDLRLPRTRALGPVELRNLDFDARVNLDAAISVELERLRGELWRDQALLGQVALRASLNDAGRPSHVALDARLAGANVVLHGSGTYARGSELRRLPGTLDLRLTGLTAEALAAVVGQPKLERAFRGAIAAELELVGSPLELASTGTLTTAGGVLFLDSKLRHGQGLELTLRADGLGLAALFAGAPAVSLSTRAALSIGPAEADTGAPLRLHATAALDDRPLPRLTLLARVLGERLSAIDVRVQDSRTSIHVKGAATLSGEAELELDADLDAAELRELAATLGRPLPEISGRLRTQIALSRTAGQVNGRAVLEGAGMFRRTPWRLESLPIVISGSSLQSQRLTLTLAGQRITLSGRYSRAASDLELAFVDVDLERLCEPFAPSRKLRGQLRARVRARGSIREPSVHVWLKGSRIEIANGISVDVQVRGALAAAAAELELDAVAWEHRGGRGTRPARLASLRAAGRYRAARLRTQVELSDRLGPWLNLGAELTWPKADLPARYASAWLGGVPPSLASTSRLLDRTGVELHVAAAPRSLHRLPSGLALPGSTDAVLSARLELTKAPLQEPRALLSAELRNRGSLPGSGRCSPEPLVARARIELERARLRAEVSASSVQRRLLHAWARGDIALRPVLRAEPLRLRGLELEAAARGLPLSVLPALCGRVKGVLDARARLELSERRPRVAVDARVAGFSRGSDEVLDLALALEADTTDVSVRGYLTAQGKASRLEARIPLTMRAGMIAIDPGGRLALAVDLKRLPVAPFVAPNGVLSYGSGWLSGALVARGTPASPQLEGRFTLSQVAFTVTAVAQPLDAITGEIVFDRDTIVLNDVSARDAGGVLSLQGSFRVQGPRALTGTVDVVARDFPLRESGRVVATTNARARLDAQLREGETRLRLELDEFDTWLEGGPPRKAGISLRPHPDLVVDGSPDAGATPTSRPARRAPSAAGAAEGRRRLTLHLSTSEGAWLRRGDFALRVESELRVRIADEDDDGNAELSVDGQIRLERGRMELLGRSFHLTPGGTLRFSGEPIPDVRITARYVDRRSRDIIEARVSGSAASPQLEFSRSGETLTANEALAAIYGGQESSDDDTEDDAEVQVKQMLAAVTAGLLSNSIRRRLGAVAPIITVAPSEDEGSTEIRAGFELDTLIPAGLRALVTGVYVEGGGTKEPSNASSEGRREREQRIELSFPYRLVLIGRHGPGATWAIDLGWRPAVP